MAGDRDRTGGPTGVAAPPDAVVLAGAAALPDAVVLAGGRSSRLGRDKAAVEVAGVPLLDRVLRAVAPVCGRVVVAGPARQLALGTLAPGRPDPVWCREDPPGGGPVAAVAAALPHVAADRVFVLAVDLPFLTARALRALAGAGPSAVAVDAAGRDQGLLGVWETARLRAALPDDPAGRSWHAVTRDIGVVRVRLPGDPAPETDCDTAADLAAATAAMAVTAGSAGSAGSGTGGHTVPVTDAHPPAGSPSGDPAGPSAPGGTDLTAWVDRVRADLDLPEVDVTGVLDLARDVAHGVARPAAPLTTLLVGLAAGRAGGGPADVASVTARIRALLDEPGQDVR